MTEAPGHQEGQDELRLVTLRTLRLLLVTANFTTPQGGHVQLALSR